MAAPAFSYGSDGLKMPRETTLLINPPLWNAYAPHLAVPLLAGVLKASNLPVRSHDASIAVLDWILSSDGQRALSPRLSVTRDERLAARAQLVHRHVLDNIDRAKSVIRDVEALVDAKLQAWARTVVRNAMWCASASFEDFTFDLVANQLYYSATSTTAVLAAIDDPERNIYRWALKHMLPDSLLDAPDLRVIGLSVSADTQLIAAMTIANRIRQRRPDVKIVMGGNFTTRMVDRWTQRHRFFDLVDAFVLSEGEEVLPEIVRRYIGGRNLDGIPGVVTAEGNELSKTPAQPVRLDNVAMPEFGDLPLGRYFAPGPILPLYASRSCAWACAFCSIPFASNNFRSRPAKQTVDHMVALMEMHGVKHFMFVDEILTLHVLQDIANEIISRGLKLFWYGETRFAGGFDRKLADILYESGCRRLNFGLESYNQRVLNLMRKGTKLSSIDSTVEAILGSGIAPHLFVIHGFPGETEEEALRTIEFAKRTVARSEFEFSNPYTTWGGAQFILDVHSPVNVEAEHFGITVCDPSDEEDLALSREYVVKTGLSSRAAAQLAHEARGGRAIRRNVWFRSSTQSTLAEVEEFTFLRACMGAPNAQPHRTSCVLTRVDETCVLYSAGAFDLMPWDADESGGFAAVALYNGDRDTFVQLNWPKNAEVTILKGGVTAGELSQYFISNAVMWGETTGADLVALLVRHGLFDGPRVSYEEVDRQTIFVPEPSVLEASSDDGLVLHSPTTGNTVRLNVIGQIVWLLCSTAGSSAELVALEFVGHDAAMIEGLRALQDLAELGFLFARDSITFPTGATRDAISVS